MKNKFTSLYNTIKYIIRHPLNRGHSFQAIVRWASWQIGSRLVGGAVAVPFIGSSKLLVSPGMTGATGNIYVGLQELEEMSFLLHFLRSSDLFIDIGGNIGAYSILASRVCGTRTVVFEPVPNTYQRLLDNIHLNGVMDIVQARQICVGDKKGYVKFTTEHDTVNHVLLNNVDTEQNIQVMMDTLDSLLEGSAPTVLKIDVEGYEGNIISGAKKILSSPLLIVVIMEVNGSGVKYGYRDIDLLDAMKFYGFQPYTYNPFDKTILPIFDLNNFGNNIIFINDVKYAEERVKFSAGFKVGSNYL